MSPTWIVVIIWQDGGVEIGEHLEEAAAREVYDAAINAGGYIDAYLASVRAEAHADDRAEEVVTDA